jgi:hypothetical protein
LGFGSVIAFVGVFVFATMHFAKKRRDALEKFYRGRGFEFAPGPESPNAFGMGSLSLFDMRRGRLRNIGKSGHANKTFFIADYSYTTGSGKSRKHHNLTVACRQSQNTLPRFTLAPEDIFSKIAQAVGYDDIDLPHDPEFSKRYVLRGEKPEQVLALFNTGVVNFIKSQQQMRVECCPSGVVWSVTGNMSQEKLQTFIPEAQRFFELLEA